MIADLVFNSLRFIFAFIDRMIFGFIGTLYNLLIDIAQTTIFTDDIIDLFASKVYALLGIFMLFKVSFSILTYIVSPDDFLDKNKGFGKLISNILIVLFLLVTTPWIFSKAMEVQRIILKDNIIGKVFSNVANDAGITSSSNAGALMAYETLNAFYHFDYDLYPNACSAIGTDKFDPAPEQGAPICDITLTEGGNITDIAGLHKQLLYSNKTKSTEIYMQADLLTIKDDDGNYIMTYTFLISTAVGVILILLLIVFCFDIAVRSVKLGFMRMIAPVPIIARLDPKKGKDTFDKWLKSCISTYLDLFIRLLAINFAVFVISLVLQGEFVDAATGLPSDTNIFVKVFIILGALLFAKQLPKLLEELTGIKLSGKFTLNPLKKLGEVPLVGGAAAAGGVMAASGAMALGRGGANLIGGGLKMGAGKALDKISGGRVGSRLAMSGKQTLTGTKAAMQRRMEAGASEARGRFSSAGVLGDEGYKGDTAHKIYVKDREKLREKRTEGRKAFSGYHEQWQTGDNMLRQVGSFTRFNGADTAAYQTAYKSQEFINSLMKLDAADSKAKELTQALETVRAGGTMTVDGTLYDSSNFNLLYDKYDKATKAKSGLEKVHETMRQVYAEDAKMQDAIKFRKYNANDPTK